MTHGPPRARPQKGLVSGTVKEVLLPIAHRLGIPTNHLLGVELNWSEKNEYKDIDSTYPVNRSKWEGAEPFAKKWLSPKIAVGDGITDYALFEHGLVDHFIAFTQHARRQAMIGKASLEANSVEALRKHLERILSLYA